MKEVRNKIILEGADAYKKDLQEIKEVSESTKESIDRLGASLEKLEGSERKLTEWMGETGVIQGERISEGWIKESSKGKETVKEKMIRLMDYLLLAAERIAKDENAGPEKMALLPVLSDSIVNITGYAVIEKNG